ncbi:MAG: response regulator [Deltaproteobacteria bacterium]|nr:response regulator [Deltaproteobacteria bacterium]
MNDSETNEHLDSIDQAFDTSTLFSSVLLVEDDVAHSKLIERALRNIVGEVRHVSSARAAMEVIGTSLTELVLSDLLLPDASGIELLKQIRQVRPNLPVIVMTGSNKIDDAVAAMREGAWDYMVKQFSEDFRERIRMVVERVAERKLQQMREFKVRAERDAFSAAVRTAKDGVAILDVSGSVVFANDSFYAFCRQLSMDFGQDNPVNVLRMIEPHDASVCEELGTHLDGQSSQGESLWHSELKVGLRGNEKEASMYYELSLTSFRMSSSNSVSPSLSLSLGNYDMRKQILWVKDITAKKEQEKFQRDLLSMTTHDLKGPMGAILTSAELLPGYLSASDTRALGLITHISSCARNCINMLDELLSVRRIQDGVMMIVPKHFEAVEIVEELVMDYSSMAEAKSIELTFEASEPQIDIFVDRIGLLRVLGNLIHNAIKFTPRGGKVKIFVQRKGNSVSISVSDTGQGIEPEARAKLFGKFTRLDKHQNVEGTGLGLFVAKSIVDAHEGRIEVKSEIGVGTTFIASFPDEVKKDVEGIENAVR